MADFHLNTIEIAGEKSRQYGDVGRNIEESEATQSGILRRIEGGSHVKPIFRMETRNFISEIGELVRRQAILGVRTPKCKLKWDVPNTYWDTIHYCNK